MWRKQHIDLWFMQRLEMDVKTAKNHANARKERGAVTRVSGAKCSRLPGDVETSLGHNRVRLHHRRWQGLAKDPSHIRPHRQVLTSRGCCDCGKNECAGCAHLNIAS